MSARITLYCDRMWHDGSCTAQLITDARTIHDAREAAGRLGWRTHPDGNDYCPSHSGRPGGRPGTNVLHLHTETGRCEIATQRNTTTGLATTKEN